MAKSLPVSPLAPERFPAIPPVPSTRWASLPSGLRYQGRDDLMLLELAPGVVDLAVLAAAVRAGRVNHFAWRQATLVELFREAVADPQEVAA